MQVLHITMFGQVNKFKKKVFVLNTNTCCLYVPVCKMQPPFLIPSVLLLFLTAFMETFIQTVSCRVLDIRVHMM